MLTFNIFIFVILFYVKIEVRSLVNNNNNNNTISNDTTSLNRIYFLKKCSGAGCPYAAAWLSHINLYRRVGWAMESTKMESASFNMLDYYYYYYYYYYNCCLNSLIIVSIK